MEYWIRRICVKCKKEISTILEPCPHCGYQHPLTETGKEEQRKLREKEPSEK